MIAHKQVIRLRRRKFLCSHSRKTLSRATWVCGVSLNGRDLPSVEERVLFDVLVLNVLQDHIFVGEVVNGGCVAVDGESLRSRVVRCILHGRRGSMRVGQYRVGVGDLKREGNVCNSVVRG